MQSRRLSAVEAIANIAIGYGVSASLTLLVLPWFGYMVTGSDALGISGIFTVASLVRSYVLRRAFDKLSRGE